jgi:hypothetical protein
MQLFLTIMLWLMISSATAYFANQRGRDPLIWFMLGMLLGFLALIFLFLLPPVQEEEPPLEAEYEILKKTSVLTPTFSLLELGKDWFYYDDKRQQQGPVQYDMIKELWDKGSIDEKTYVWSEGMGEWAEVKEIENLYDKLTTPLNSTS